MSNYTIKELPNLERPRERLLEVGVNNLSDKELLAIILKNGTKNKNVNDLSLELLNKYSINELEKITIEELIKINGIGIVKAIEIIASIELGKRIFLKKPIKLIKFNDPNQIYENTKYLFFNKKQEYFYCFYLNNRHELLERKLLFMGTINGSITHPREIFKEAYKLSASSIICMHNHPSGDIHPSKADLEFTNNLVKIGRLQGIPIVDHIITADNDYYSFYENGDINNL